FFFSRRYLHSFPTRRSSDLTFHAITLSGDPIHYRYRIGEKESSWSEWSASNNVTFPSLQPGHYTLEVQCRAGSNQQIAGTLTYQDRKSTRLNSSHVKISYAV